jgi:hypothetical protein
MFNLYSETKGQEALRRWFRFSRDLAGNLPPLPANLSRTAWCPIVVLGAPARIRSRLERNSVNPAFIYLGPG